MEQKGLMGNGEDSVQGVAALSVDSHQRLESMVEGDLHPGIRHSGLKWK